MVHFVFLQHMKREKVILVFQDIENLVAFGEFISWTA